MSRGIKIQYTIQSGAESRRIQYCCFPNASEGGVCTETTNGIHWYVRKPRRAIPFCRSTILPFCHSAFLPFCFSAVLPFCYSAVRSEVDVTARAHQQMRARNCKFGQRSMH